MITYTQFETAITAIVEQCDHDEKVKSALDTIAGTGFCGVVDPGPAVRGLEKLLEDVMHDVDGWISYWLWDLDRGRKSRKGMVTIDGKAIPLKTIKQLYRLLVSEAKTRQEFLRLTQ